MKMVNETLGAIKGTDKVSDILTGKGVFSQSGFSDIVSALANDTTFKIPTYDKNGEKTGEQSISEMIRADLKSTLEKAKYPQKSESSILDTCDIVTKNLAKAIPEIVFQSMATGKKFDLPYKPGFQGGIYLKDVPAGSKTSQVRDPKTQQNLGTSTSTYKDSIAVAAKSKIPAYLVTKVRKDVNGNVIK